MREQQRPILIGYGGWKESGKDASADFLVNTHGWTKLNMSDPLNDALLTLNPWIEDPWRYFSEYRESVVVERYANLHELVGYTRAKNHAEVRRLLQYLGTEVGRKMIDPDVWVQIAAKRILELREAAELLGAGANVAITGIRYENELDMIEQLGGHSVWVHRPSLTPPSASEHSSEVSLNADNFDYQIVNDETLAVLYERTDEMVEGFREHR